MSPFSIPVPSIIALRLPVFGGPKSIDTDTKVQLSCETYLECEIFYTLDGTKPQPYAGIVQGNKTIKYSSPFCLPSGKVTIKAIAINANVHTMCSSIVTKCFEVLKAESTHSLKQSAKIKRTMNSKVKKSPGVFDNRRMSIQDEKIYDSMVNKFNSISVNDDGNSNCLDEAFIGSSNFETVNSDVEDSIEDKSDFPDAQFDDEISDNSEGSDDVKSFDNVDECDAVANGETDCAVETEDMFIAHDEKVEPNVTLTNDSAASVETQFCCLKCDMTLQHCSSCNRMNAVSSKYCIECGKQLTQICFSCKEHNPSVATFCQFCGEKLNSTHNTKMESCSKVDHSVMAKPQLKNAGIQKLPVLMDKCTQTISERSPVKKNSTKLEMKRLPRLSPGRGYWHQQLDYICNHLKSHAYNNMDFRKEISEPTLCDFQCAHITKDENNVTVTIIFSPLLTDKCGINASEEIKSKDSA